MKKLIIILSILAGITLLVLGVYKIFLASKIPQAFTDKFNETVVLGKDAERLSDLTNMPEMNALDKQMSSEDYSGALKSVEAAMGRKKEASSKLNSIDSKLAELKTLSSEISKAEIKAGTDKFLDMYKKENSAKINYINLQIKMFEKVKEMISILVKNPKAISAADEKAVNDLSKQIDDLKNQIDNAEKEVDNIQSQFKTIEKEFFELAGLEITK